MPFFSLLLKNNCGSCGNVYRYVNKRQSYLDWAARTFQITAGGVDNHTQNHTYMCYSKFNDIIVAIAEMDANVITIETSLPNMELLDAFESYDYPNEIGPDFSLNINDFINIKTINQTFILIATRITKNSRASYSIIGDTVNMTVKPGINLVLMYQWL